MNLLLAVLGVGFGAFCLWLGVRLVNRRERWAKWTAGLIATMVILYPLSFPWAYGRAMISAKAAEKKGEPFPGWIVPTMQFYEPFESGASDLPNSVVAPYLSYCAWSMRISGIDETFIFQ